MQNWIVGLERATALLAVAACLALSGTGLAAATTLQDALVNTYLTSPRLEAGRAQLRQADELVPQALSGYRPQLFLNGGINHDRTTTRAKARTLGGVGVFEQNRTAESVGVTVRQNLYAGGGTQAAVSRAENQVRAQRAQLLALEQSVLLDTVSAYTAVYRDQVVLDLALNNEQRLQRQLQATRDRFQVGEVARTDVAQAEARLSRAQADVESAKADLAASRAAYRRVVGEEPTNLVEPKTLVALPKTLADAQALAASNPDIVAATFSLYAARDAVDVAYADLLPSLDLQAQAQLADEPTYQTNWSRSTAIGLNLTIPLYQGGGEYARVRENRQLERQRRNELETAHRTVQEQVAASWDRLLAATAAIEAFRAEIKANEIALEGVQQEALVGSRTVLDVLDAEQELFTSQVNLVRARAEEILASYQLKLAVGQLTVDDLGLSVQPFDAEAHYQRTRTRLFGLSD
ncbi:TolC family outer membrane protein [Benzoatithermus flavus]|uniref:TolC family outer membrane protein n=1 Tax=Benzoatithermus flavus TaxID=3108223 RepID=A0ABU8XZR8_9PROT